MATTRIDWADKVWNPITGCTPISPGCAHCYAARFAKRLAGRCGYPKRHPFRVTFHPDHLEDPLHWRKPQTVFVCSMGDLFHADVSIAWQESVYETMRLCPRHRFLVLTKRASVMRDRVFNYAEQHHVLENVWHGVSVSMRDEAESRIPYLLKTPSAGKFVSVEPMLGPVNVTRFVGRFDGLSWVVCGGETGPSARHIDATWVASLRLQCWEADIPFWFKQRNRHGDDILDTLDGPRTYKQTPWGDKSETDGAKLRARIECP